MIKEIPTDIRHQLSQKASFFINDETLIIDTETTGLEADAEIVEIAILSINGDVLLDTLIKPLGRINPKAMEVHGITDEMVKNAPSFADIAPTVYEIINNKTLVAHNVSFDQARLDYELSRCGYEDVGYASTACTMRLSMATPNERRKSLGRAMEWLEVEHEGSAHRASYDAECCRLLLLRLASLSSC